MQSAPFSVTPILVLIYLLSLVIGTGLGVWFDGQGAQGLVPAILVSFFPIAIAGKVRFVVAKKFNEIVKAKGNVPIAYPLHIRLLIGFALSTLVALVYTWFYGGVIDGIAGAKLALISAVAYTVIMYGKVLITETNKNK